MDCRNVQRMIWAGEAHEDVAAHVPGCRDCRAELARATDVRTALSELRYLEAVPTFDLESAILEGLDLTWGRRAREVVTGHPRFWRGVGVGAAAAAATAVGLIGARKRLRPDLAA